VHNQKRCCLSFTDSETLNPSRHGCANARFANDTKATFSICARFLFEKKTTDRNAGIRSARIIGDCSASYFFADAFRLRGMWHVTFIGLLFENGRNHTLCLFFNLLLSGVTDLWGDGPLGCRCNTYRVFFIAA